MQITMKEMCEILRSRNSFSLLTHKSPDGDTLGSGFALKYALEKLGKDVDIYCNDKLPKKFSYLGTLDDFEKFNPSSTTVGIDLADTSLLGPNLVHLKDNIELCIDHHFSNALYAEKSLVEPKAAATAEIVYDIINLLGVEIDEKIASCIYTGIATDTGCFRYPNTTSYTHTVAAKMFELGCNFKQINKQMFETKTKTQLEIEKSVLNSLETFFDGRCAIIEIPHELKVLTGANDDDLDAFSAIPRQIEGVMVGVTLKEKVPGIVKVSVRTDGETIDASRICKTFNGGGHHAAAGCVIEESISDAKQKILEALGKELGEYIL